MRRIYEARAYGPLPVEDCFWRTSLNGVASDPTAEGEIDCDYAVIGAGFTGLNAALGLAESGADVAVLEAEQPGWGASGRNGGFVCLGGDRLDQRSLVARFGAEDVALYRRAQLASVDLVADNLDRYGIDADRHSDGETLLAHKPRHAARLDAYAAEIETVFGVRPSVYRAGDLKDLGLGAHGTHGAMTTPVGFALNPGKYVAGLAAAARQAGARLFGRSPVTGVKHCNDIWELSTKQALIKAKYLIWPRMVIRAMTCRPGSQDGTCRFSPTSWSPAR